MSKRPEFEYYIGIANQPLHILGGENSLKSELSDLVEESIYCIEDLETEIQTLKQKCDNLKNESKFKSGEDKAHKSVQYEIYQYCGIQKGDWNGAKPVIDYIKTLKEKVRELEKECNCPKVDYNGSNNQLCEFFNEEDETCMYGKI